MRDHAKKGELAKAPARVGKKGVSEEKTLTALKSHSEAERRRRERITAGFGGCKESQRATTPRWVTGSGLDPGGLSWAVRGSWSKIFLSFSFATSVSKGCL